MILFLCVVVSLRPMLPQHASSQLVDLKCAVGLLDHPIAVNA
jgi:hypothetical protein